MATEDQVTAAAIAMRSAAETFGRPVNLYVEGEARRRWEAEGEDRDAYLDRPGVDWELESWKLLARAALESLSWRDIETAPRDGSWVLTFGRNGFSAPLCRAICAWEDGSWSVVHDAEGYRWDDFEPLLWAPLLAEPTRYGKW